jgi:hypothetical protein
MFTAIAKALAVVLASRNIKAAAAVAPYVAFATPLVVNVVAFIVGYLHGDKVARVALALVAINEALAATAIHFVVDDPAKS